ncbi:hypothetical protein [Jannaschia seosinensis]|nr:hypothetical protein [Jannaschia seosinensis]
MSAFLEVLKEKAEELKTSPPAGVKATELTSAVRELAKAIMFAQEQKGKVDDVLRQESGGDGIDFDAARLEIGRRLDRIRDAEGPEVVP